jgi:cold shock CspA family protein
MADRATAERWRQTFTLHLGEVKCATAGRTSLVADGHLGPECVPWSRSVRDGVAEGRVWWWGQVGHTELERWVAVSVGTILRFDDIRGYGFISPAEGGDDVFVHANDFGLDRHLVRSGISVEYEAEEGDRGLKVATVRLIEGQPPVRTAHPIERDPGAGTATGDDDGLCDVLAPHEFTTEVTETMLRNVPSLTGAQIVQVRAQVVELARAHGWVVA